MGDCMIKCPACGNSYNEALSECPACGFPNISVIHASEEEYQQILEHAEEYRKTLNIFTHVFLLVARNELNEQTGTVQVRETEMIFLGNTRTMQSGTIYWYPEFFAAQTGPLDLQVMCCSDAAVSSGSYMRFTESEESHVRTIRLTNPDVPALWHVGIMAENDGGFRLCVGTQLRFTSSDPIRFTD